MHMQPHLPAILAPLPLATPVLILVHRLLVLPVLILVHLFLVLPVLILVRRLQVPPPLATHLLPPAVLTLAILATLLRALRQVNILVTQVHLLVDIKPLSGKEKSVDFASRH